MSNVVKVSDKITENSAIITNLLMSFIILIGSLFGNSVLDNLKTLNENVSTALIEIASIKGKLEGLEERTKKLEAWQESSREPYHAREPRKNEHD